MNKNMTALVSCFVRYYHTKNSNLKIYSDIYAEKILTNDEIKNISKYLKDGIKFFNPNYKGEEPLKWIVNNNLAPSILARSALNEMHVKNDIKLGLKQFVILASGYDTSAFKFSDKVKVFELDKTKMIEDKLRRVKASKLDSNNIEYIGCDFNHDWVFDLFESTYNTNEKSLFSMLGLSYYLDKETFKQTIKKISGIMPSGSTIIFDYPNEFETNKEIINKKLARAAGEVMKSTYSYNDIESIASEANLLVYEHLNNRDIDNNFFYDYNTINPNNKIVAPKGISYAVLVKK